MDDGLFVIEYLGAGCGRINGTEEFVSKVVRAIGTGSVDGLVLRSLLLLTKFSLFLRKSGSSQLISVPRWSSNRKRWARFSPSRKSAETEGKFINQPQRVDHSITYRDYLYDR